MAKRPLLRWFLAVLAQTATWGAAGAAAAPASDRDHVAWLADAQRAFDRGTERSRESPEEARAAFCEAAELFRRVVDAGVENGRLYYNLGNALLRCGRTGRAIAAYRRAEAFIPTDARLQSNLDYARSLCRYDIPETGERAVARTIFFWHYETPLRWRFLAGLSAWALFWLCLIGRTFWRGVRWRYPAGVCLAIWLTLGVSVGAEIRHDATHRAGVVVANDVVVRKGNGLGYEPQFEETLSEGVEFDLLEQRDDWLHLRLPDGQEGWIRAHDAELI